jgi:formate C-acetyltransferase
VTSPGAAPRLRPAGAAEGEDLAAVTRALDALALSPRVARLRELHLKAMPELCLERARLVTRHAREHRQLGGRPVSALEKARLYAEVLARKAPIIAPAAAYRPGHGEVSLRDAPLPRFGGSTTARFKGVALYPELLGLALWPELGRLGARAANPYRITPAEVEELSQEIFPAWVDGHVAEVARLRGRGRWERVEEELFGHMDVWLLSKLSCISHTVPDLGRVLRRGLLDLADEACARSRRARTRGEGETWQALAEAMRGVVAWGRRLAEAARGLAAGEPDPGRRAELLALAEAHARVPAEPARTFREGLTAVWTCWNALLLESPDYGLSLGRLDQLLVELYREDRAQGRLELAEALELCCDLWLKLGDHVPAVPGSGEAFFGATGSNQAVTIGGVGPEGRSAVNEVSLLLLRTSELMRLRDPNLAARHHPGVTPRSWLRRLCLANLRTGATPAVHNDRAVIRALMGRGDSLAQARDYAIVGCVEPASAGRTFGHSAAILLDLPAVLDLALFSGRRRGGGPVLGVELEEPATFEAFRCALRAQLERIAERTTSLNDLLAEVHRDLLPTPILSALFEGPLECGRDVTQGGAVVNASGVAVVGFADVVDSLTAVQACVYERRSVTLERLRGALRADLAGEPELAAMLSRCPRYGSDDPAAADNAAWLVRALDAAFGARANARGGRYRVGYWSMTMHVGWGALAGALPSGRRAGAPFASGMTPASGGGGCLAATLSAAAALPAEALAGGMALNVRFGPHAPERAVDDLAASVEAYFDGPGGRGPGGMEVQFTILDPDQLARACRDPERHGDLMVRVSGYTAYFRDLSPAVRREILARAAFGLGGEAGEAATFTIREEGGA